MNREYIALIGFNVFTEKSGDWIDRVEIIETDREYPLVVRKEILALNLPNENGDIDKGVRFSDRDPDIIKSVCDMIVYLPLPEDAYKVTKWRVIRFIKREKRIYSRIIFKSCICNKAIFVFVVMTDGG